VAIKFIVLWLEKNGLPIHATLDYVLGYLWDEVTGLTRHHSLTLPIRRTS
jgi:hypothetical protein